MTRCFNPKLCTNVIQMLLNIYNENLWSYVDLQWYDVNIKFTRYFPIHSKVVLETHYVTLHVFSFFHVSACPEIRALSVLWLLEQNEEPWTFLVPMCKHVKFFCSCPPGFPCRWLWAAGSSERTLSILSINYTALRKWDQWRNYSVKILTWASTTMMTRENRRNNLNFYNIVFIVYSWQVKVVYDT